MDRAAAVIEDLKELGKGLFVILMGFLAAGLGWHFARELARAVLR